MGEYFTSHKELFLLLAAALLSFALCSSSIPRIIYISKKKKLFDQPDNNRKLHAEVIPNLGGIGIYLGFSVIASLFIHTAEFDKWNYFVAGTLILFVTGIKDDLINVNPAKKFLAQVAASLIIAFFADIRLDNLYGILGVHQLPYWGSVLFTVVGCTFISNAFNLIDGIDGLAGSIAVVCCLFLGVAFAMSGNISLACIAFSLMGAILGFLRFNVQPARIFMGDSGSLVIGFTIAVLSILLTDTMQHFETNVLFHSPKAVLMGTLALLFIPVFDTFRVFIARIIKGKSPFHADRTHLHHYLLDLGFSHTKTVLVLIFASLLIVALTFFAQDYPVNVCFMLIVTVSLVLFSILYVLRKSKMGSANETPDRADLPLPKSKSKAVV